MRSAWDLERKLTGRTDEGEDSVFQEWLKGFRGLDPGQAVKIPKETTKQLSEHIYENIITDSLQENLERTFSSQLGKLVKRGHRSFRLDIHDNLQPFRVTLPGSKGRLKLRKFPSLQIQLTRRREESGGRLPFDSAFDEGEGGLTLEVPGNISLSAIQDEIVYELMRALEQHVLKGQEFAELAPCHYLPAGRSGLLQSHDILAVGAFNRLSQVGLEPIEVPAFSGVISQFLQGVTSLARKEEGSLSHLADELEDKALEGTVKVKKRRGVPSPHIVFVQEGDEHELHLASTSVSEIAPLVLFTRYILEPGSTVIIEEPEAHLHPENQRRVAKFVSKLVDNGVHVVITTHSDYFLEQINNSIRLDAANAESEADDPVAEGFSALPPEEVAVHVFKEKKDGFHVDPVEIDKEGVDLDEFLRIHEEMYEETYEIDELRRST